MALRSEDFPAFFQSVHGYRPFPWQVRLAKRVVETGRWPSLLDLPTASGKTAALDVAVFHLACEAEKGQGRKAPLRILFVIDRRIVVDAAFERGRKIADKLMNAKGGVLQLVADRLRQLAGPKAPPLDVVRLRGGVPQERDWVRSPTQPVIAVSTVDQVGSRLLFRGYGVSPRMWPVHAGLVGSDALWLLDEVHLSKPLEETLESIIAGHKSQDISPISERPRLAPFVVVKLSATPGDDRGGDVFRLEDEDRQHEILKPRISTQKLATLEQTEEDPTDAFVAHALRFTGFAEPVAEEAVHRVAVVVNRVDLARRVFEKIVRAVDGRAEVILLTGRIRPLDRDVVLKKLEPLYANAKRSTIDKPVILVATQTIEAGADLDVEALVTEIAPLDSLRQRFGRLDRLGLRGRSRAVILYPPGKPSKGESAKDDPWLSITRIYGESAFRTKEWLKTLGDEIDFGIDSLEKRLVHLEKETLDGLLAPQRRAPVLLAPYVTLWAMTSPAPAATPEPSLFLHGPAVQADVQIVWRDGINPYDQAIPISLELCPPSALEALSVPIWAVRRWLRQDRRDIPIADVPEEMPKAELAGNAKDRPVWFWDGETWTRKYADDIRPGDMIVVPSDYGGCDQWGWNPQSNEVVADLGAEAHYRQRQRGALCITLNGLANALTKVTGPAGRSVADEIWKRVSYAIEEMEDDIDAERVRMMLTAEEALPEIWKRLLAGMEHHEPSIEFYDDENRGRGFVLFAKARLEKGLLDCEKEETEDGADAITAREDSSGIGKEVLLLDHLSRTEAWAREFARRSGLSAHFIELIGLAARLHDIGKADPRFQADLHNTSALALHDPELLALLIPSSKILAKSSGRGSGAGGRFGKLRATPENFRHEALSVALAAKYPNVTRLTEEERDLVLWLVGTHHGYGRPFFPPCIDHSPYTMTELKLDGAVLSAEAHEAPLRLDQGWLERAERLLSRYSPWELARLEAILRLADHAASAEEQN